MNDELVKQSNPLSLRDPQAITLFNQLRLMISNGQRLSDLEAATLANFARIEGLDPFSGECHLLKGRDGKVAGCMVGIKGLRRKAQEALIKAKPEDTSNYFSVTFKEIPQVQGSEIEIMVEATLRDSISMQKYIDIRTATEKMLRENGQPGVTSGEITGSAPTWVGYGQFLKSEHDPYKDKKFSPLDRAKKRAEANVIKQRFNLSYQTRDENGLVEVDNNIVDVVEITPGEIPADLIKAQPPKADTAPWDHADPDTGEITTTPNEWGLQYAKALVSAKIVDNEPHAMNMLKLSNLIPGCDVNQVLKWAEIYKKFRAEGCEAKDAAAKANTFFKKV